MRLLPRTALSFALAFADAWAFLLLLALAYAATFLGWALTGLIAAALLAAYWYWRRPASEPSPR
jgi:hypothetical protein